MKFALNYSLPAIEYLKSGEIECDYLKCPDWPDLIPIASQYRPVVVHFDLAAGRNTLGSADWGMVERLLAQTETTYVNLHYYPSTKAYPGVDQALEAALDDIRSVVARFGSDKVIVENLPYPMPEGDFPLIAANPVNLGKVLAETGAGLLLDVAHAMITARNEGIDEREHLAAFPVERLREMHLTGVDWHEGKRYDHLPMTDPDWVTFGWVTEQIRKGQWTEPGYLGCEYGGIGDVFKWRTDPEVIRTQTSRIYQMCHQVGG